MKKILAISVLLACVACNTEGVKKDPSAKKPTTVKRHKGPKTAEELLEPYATIQAKKEFPNGIKIQWFERGKGDNLRDGEVYEINFKVKLVNGDVVDGNHLLKRDWLPFLVGFNMQGAGWDMALKELKSGDFVEVFLPAKLARGKRSVEGLIPPNSPNVLMVRVGKRIPPTRVIDGVKVWKLEERKDDTTPKVSEKSAVAINYFVGSQSNPYYDNSYQRNAPFSFHMDDFGLVPGFRKALINAKLYDKLWIVVPSDQAYGKKGFQDLVKPNESMFYDLFVVEVDGKK